MAILSAPNKNKPKSKKWAGRSGPELLNDIASQVEQAEHVGAGQLKWVAMAEITTDPEQPRTKLQQLGINRDSVMAHIRGETNLSDPAHPERAEAFEKLEMLARTIREDRLIQPITLYRSETGSGYVIETGERRYLAHLLMGASEIRAIVSEQVDLHKKKRRQLVENVARENLSLKEMIDAIISLNALHERTQGTRIKGTELASLLGMTDRHAQRLIKIAFGPQDVIDAVRDERITNFAQALDVLRYDSPAIRREMIETGKAPGTGMTDEGARHSGEDDGGATPKPDQSQTAAELPGTGRAADTKHKKKGRPAQVIQLGTTQSANTVCKIMRHLLGDDEYAARYSDVDWTDFSAVNRAWRTFWQNMEKTT